METPQPEELLKKIQELEAGQAKLKQDVLSLMPGAEARRAERPRSHSVSPQRTAGQTPRKTSWFEGSGRMGWRRGSSSFGPSSRLQKESRESSSREADAAPPGIDFSSRQYLNILQSLGQSVHIFDLDWRIIYWNRTAERLYGYSEAEALGQDAIELLVDSRDSSIANTIFQHITMGENWTGKFLVSNKFGERFLAVATNTPFYDDDGNLVGIICVSSDSRSFQEETSPVSCLEPHASSFSSPGWTRVGKVGTDSQQPLQVAIASKITNLANKVTNKVRLKIRTYDNSTEREIMSGDSQCSDHVSLDADQKEDATSSGASTPRGDLQPSPFGISSSAVSEEKSPGKASRASGEDVYGKTGIHKIIGLRAEAWIAKKAVSWPWKGHEPDAADAKNRFGWPWSHSDQESDLSHQKPSESTVRQGNRVNEGIRTGNKEASGSGSSLNINSISSISSNGSTSSNVLEKVDADTDCLDFEILWEDLTIGEQIGQGSCGTVYHALWYGSDVAVKVFAKQEYSDEIIHSFRQEVSLMKTMRHPNILLFMGAVTSPQRLCIITEFLPRGSLFQLLQKNTTRLDWRRRTHMALDIARGMNYLHHRNPPIIHRDLKSSNLLVDKNWTVKVGDFGLSRLKNETYFSTKTGKGTPQWMAPEVLRNEHSDEKSDVYSYGVVLWELVTEKIPWDNLNSMQVIGAVGFMNQRLELPEDLDPQWVSIIESCWHSEPSCRPTFQELLERFKDLQRQTIFQSQMQRISSRAAAKSIPED
ncbi:hypothetical protein J5N97_008839 [Dioscorea zingiberensis]|uniref:non-specific serine/threonine protein kinase n=1 Tax=Dioscorea zingiberensis TaxID=325984 RepID=A0A9D5HL48_9LILI|nr:hypothetical protein J5N97_008839 [Dioscorea zingiberensis]